MVLLKSLFFVLALCVTANAQQVSQESVQTHDPNSIERGNFGPFRRSLNDIPADYQVIPDPTSTAPSKMIEKFLVKDGDCGKTATWNDCEMDRERSELSEKERTNKEGSVIWYGWSLYFPKDYPQIYPTKVALGQFHQDDSSPLWMFQQNDEGYFLEGNFLSPKKVYELVKDKNLREKWHKIEIEIKWSAKADGYLKLWVNGEPKVDYKGPTKQSHEVYFKYGLYRSFLNRYKSAKKVKSIPEQYVYYANVKRALSRQGLQNTTP